MDQLKAIFGDPEMIRLSLVHSINNLRPTGTSAAAIRNYGLEMEALERQLSQQGVELPTSQLEQIVSEANLPKRFMKKFTDRKRTAGVMVNREINEDHQ
jgi:hypothetical protein